jgi:PTH1 family peptidyl-tRNA hydrolase
MLLIVGLGNPGAKFVRQRHNVGFMALDVIHHRHGFAPWRKRFHAETAEGVLSGEKCLLVKPQTYMNRSGQAVGEAAGFFKLAPTDVVVIHDEVDLPPGKTRMKTGGGVAGHNGLRSIGGAIGNDFRRLRIGIGHPGVKEHVPHYVLHDFSKADTDWLIPLLDAIADHAPLLAEGKDSTFANRLHEATKPKSVGGGTMPAKGPKPEAKSSAQNRPQTDLTAQPEGPLARGLKRLFGRNSA